MQLLLLWLIVGVACATPVRARQTTSATSKKEPFLFSLEIDLPLDFGKTHFIVGYPEDAVPKATHKKTTSVPLDASAHDFMCDGCVKRVLFAPDDNVQKALLYLIEHEQHSIRLAIFAFTDGDIAQALSVARGRGIAVDIIADAGNATERFSKIPLLKAEGFNVFTYNPDYKKSNKKGLISSIMHNKFIIFGKNLLNKSLVWTGSFNLTKSAHRHNQENVVVLDDSHVVQKYAEQFELLKGRSRYPKKVTQAQKKRSHSVPNASPLCLSKKGTVFEDTGATRA